MIQPFFLRRSHVRATVEAVLPHTGVAHLTDENASCWTVTRSTPGVDLTALRPGNQGTLTVDDMGEFSLASGFTPLD